MEKRHIEYNMNLSYIEEQEKLGNLYVIRPNEPIIIKKVEKDPEKLKHVYENGRTLVLPLIKDIKDFLK